MALKGLRVLDLTRLLPGPLCTHLLTRLGAQVIKVEGIERGPNVGDYTRTSAPMLYENINAGKESVSINLRDAAGKELFKKLVANADVLIEGNRPGAMKRLGLDYDSLKKLNQRLIYCSISGYGATGPLSQRAGHDINYQALSGLLGISGNEGSLPPLTGFQPADGAGAMQAAIGILAAVVGRHTTGYGQFIDVSLCEAAMTLGVASLSTSLAADSRPAKRGTGFLDGGLPQYNIYETKDKQFISVGALEPHFWEIACGKIGSLPTTAADVEAVFRTRDLDEWISLFADSDVCIEPVLKPEELFSHPHHVNRGVLSLPVDSTSGLPHIVMGPRLSECPAQRLAAAPRQGQHTASVLAALGMSQEEVAALQTSRAIYIESKEYWSCTCSKSSKLPYCDGSHKGTTFKPVKVSL